MTPSGYSERLLPGWWVWLVAIGLVLMVAVAYGAALGASVGWLTLVAGAILAGALIWTSAPVLTVTDRGVQAAKALLPPSAIGEIRILGPEGIAALRGPGADARVFTVLRPSSAPGGLLIHVVDDTDPHPAWLITCRHPESMAAAITATMEPKDRPRLEE